MQLHERSTPLNTSHMEEPSRRKSNARTSNPSTQFHHTHHVTDRSKAMSEDRSRVSQQQVHNPRKFLRKVQKGTENRQPTTPLNSMVDGTNKPDVLPSRNRHGQDNFRGVCQTVYHNRNLCSALSFKPARVKEIGSIDSVVPTCVHGQNTSDKRRPKSARSAHHRPGRFLSQGWFQSTNQIMMIIHWILEYMFGDSCIMPDENDYGRLHPIDSPRETNIHLVRECCQVETPP